VDGVGLKQSVGASFSWTVQLSSDILDVNITSGPPAISVLQVSTFQLYSHKNGEKAQEALFEAKLDEAVWSEASVFCHDALCNYSTPSLPLSPHEIQIRAKDTVTGVPGPPALWRWTVAECAHTEYAEIDSDGSLNCSACPIGGNCSVKYTTLNTVVANPGWWAPPGDNATQRQLRRTATFYSCPLPGSMSIVLFFL
jgi:hypothetical protein